MKLATTLKRLFTNTGRKSTRFQEVHIGQTWETNHYSFTVLSMGECPWVGETIETILYGRAGVWVYVAVEGFDEVLCHAVKFTDWLPLQAVRETVSECKHTEPDNYTWDYAALARLIAPRATLQAVNSGRW